MCGEINTLGSGTFAIRIEFILYERRTDEIGNREKVTAYISVGRVKPRREKNTTPTVYTLHNKIVLLEFLYVVLVVVAPSFCWRIIVSGILLLEAFWIVLQYAFVLAAAAAAFTCNSNRMQ